MCLIYTYIKLIVRVPRVDMYLMTLEVVRVDVNHLIISYRLQQLLTEKTQ